MNRKPRILFLVMSAVSRPTTVDQLARALLPHRVLVHHDFSQTEHFPLQSQNVEFVPNPKRTGWAVWGFTEAVFHSLDYALKNLEFDYLQLLSPGCLPIKSMQQFETHVGGGENQAHFGCLDLLADRDVLMTVGYRAFTPDHTLRHRIMKRLSLMYFGANPGRRDVEGVWIRSGYAKRRDGSMKWTARLALAGYRTMAKPAVGRHIFDQNFRPYYGSAWFGAQRWVIENMLAQFSQPEIPRYFSRLHICEEFLLPTLLKRSGAAAGPSNHLVNVFNEANPRWLTDDDFASLRDSPKFFARKFPDDPDNPLRRRVIEELVGTPPQP